MTKRRILPAVMTAAFLTVVFIAGASARLITCSECGMSSDQESPFTARVIDGEKELYFCDIGDLFVYLNRKKPQNGLVQVKDYPTGTWIDARTASYVQSKKFKSPMGWGIAAFKDEKQATGNGAAIDYAGVIKAVQ
jgi:nitrous oxide reductase accessory protein NosL